MRFEPGRMILHRNLRHGRLGWVRPARVVSDDERGLLVWVAPASPVANEVAEDGRGMRAMPFTEWITLGYRLAPGTWDGPGVLKFLPTGAAHSVWWFRDRTAGSPAGTSTSKSPPCAGTTARWPAWTSSIRTSMSWVPANQRWRWKDEDEFADRLAFPSHYWVPDEAAVRAEGERVMKVIEAGEFPFDGTWCDFHPDPAWPTPTELPLGWDRRSAR